MKFEYKISANDFLEFQLFTASTDPMIQKRKMRGWITMTIACILFAVFSFINGMIFLSGYFVILMIVVALFYPRYFKWRYKKQYAAFIYRNYSKRFGEPAELEITKDYIRSIDKVADGKIKLSQILSIHETINHFFIKIDTGMSFIIPKLELDESIDLKVEFKKIGLKVKDQTDWVW
jgi:hypothetical protein